jgi:hypothetical protein
MITVLYPCGALWLLKWFENKIFNVVFIKLLADRYQIKL